MTSIKAFDRSGSGLNIGVNGGSPLSGSGTETTLLSETDLGNSRYLLKYSLDGSDIANEINVLVYLPEETPYVTAISYLNNGYSILDIWNTSTSIYDFIERGEIALLIGNDAISGNKFSDNINGLSGDDSIRGNAGNDRLTGQTGSDRLDGGAGADALFGGTANDRLIGGGGDDRLSGGSDKDRFVFNNGDGHDTILGFQNGVDRIEISGATTSFSQVRVIDRGADTELRFSDNSVLLENIDHRAIERSDFVFN